MLSENFTPTFLKSTATYHSRPIFSPQMQPQILSYNTNFLNQPQSPVLYHEEPLQAPNFSPSSKEITRLNLRIKVLEKEKLLEAKERGSLTELVKSLKVHNNALESQLKTKLLKEPEGEGEDLYKRLLEQEELFLKKEKLFEDERGQLLKVLSLKDALIAEIQDDRQKEYQFIIEDLKQQLEEKQMNIEQLSQSNQTLIQTVEELKMLGDTEKEEAFKSFEEQKDRLEEKISKVLQENEKVVLFNNGLLNEVESLRLMNHDLEDRHSSHLEEIKSIYKAQLESFKGNIKSNFDIERKSLENQIFDLKSYSDNLNRKFEEIVQENQNLRSDKENTDIHCGNRVSEIEEKMLVLLEKNQDLLTIIDANKEEIEGLRRDIKDLSNENLGYIEKYKKENERALLSQQGLERHETQFQNEIEDLKSDKLKLEGHLQDMEHKILDLLADNEKLNNALLDRIKENELLKISLTENRILNEKNEDLHRQIEHYSNKLKDLDEKFEKLLSENGKLNQIFEKTHKDYETYKARVAILENELESKLNVIIIINI